jgi:hypothetical protein
MNSPKAGFSKFLNLSEVKKTSCSANPNKSYPTYEKYKHVPRKEVKDDNFYTKMRDIII